MLSTAEFLFPSVKDFKYPARTKVLVIGSCLAQSLVDGIKSYNSEIEAEFILVNNIVEPTPAQAVIESDIRIIQIPLRSVLGDNSFKHKFGLDIEANEKFLDNCKYRLQAIFSSMLSFGGRSSVTLAANFIVPQGILAPSLMEVGTNSDLRNVVVELNLFLQKLLSEYGVALLDLEMIAQSHGKINFLDDFISFSFHGSFYYADWSEHEMLPNWTRPERGRIEDIPPLADDYSCNHSGFLEAVCFMIRHIFLSLKQSDQIKIVIFDLDNTLWRGLSAEHYDQYESKPYTDGWPLGVWEAIHILKNRGIMVAIASKNDYEIVKSRWSSIVVPPIINLSDFDFIEISWSEKSASIQKILQESKLTDISCLFVDDNPIERWKVKSAFPNIRTIGSNPFHTKRFVTWASEAQPFRRTAETASKSKLIAEVGARDNAAVKMDRTAFLSSLDLSVESVRVKTIEDSRMHRIFELLNKTNQFNTNGRKWTMNELEAFLNRGGHIFSFSASDIYSNYGLIAVALCLGNEITQLVMSCRVIGLDIETYIIGCVVNDIRKGKILANESATIFAAISFTEKNTPCRDVYKKAGFVSINSVSQLVSNFELPPNSFVNSVNHIKESKI